MYRILRCLEAPGRSQRQTKLSGFKRGKYTGWVRLKNLSRVFGGSERLEVTNVSRIVALGSSMCRVLRRLEAPRRPDSNVAKRSVCSGWVRLKNHSRVFGGSESLRTSRFERG